MGKEIFIFNFFHPCKILLKFFKNRVAYNTEDDIKRVDSRLFKKPNPEILEYMKKREIELKCANFEVLMENKVSCFFIMFAFLIFLVFL